jgi:hypothetical protein
VRALRLRIIEAAEARGWQVRVISAMPNYFQVVVSDGRCRVYIACGRSPSGNPTCRVRARCELRRGLVSFANCNYCVCLGDAPAANRVVAILNELGVPCGMADSFPSDTWHGGGYG